MSKNYKNLLNDQNHIKGRDRDGHRWPIKEGWRCMYCGIIDPRIMAVLRNGYEPEILLATIDSCISTETDKIEIDKLFPMP